ncbi:uncharacterized protein EI90DRAFT_3090722, partial [Cantharellus anzutake]|uniref:uncharacterized protein n=1 Tax=Cantharellus anzutake TaxID=1750568 RepID=UPI001904C122
MPPFLAGDQGLTPTLQRLSRITKHEYPNYASLSQPAPPPIIDSSPLSDSGNQENVDDRGDREHANTSHILGLARLHGEIRREYERVEKFLKSDEGWESRPPLSTNAPYLIAVWDELIASRGVTAVGKIFKLPKKADGTSLVRGKIPGVSNESIKVDVVSEFGKKWTRV